jgi:hypothetical protein
MFPPSGSPEIRPGSPHAGQGGGLYYPAAELAGVHAFMHLMETDFILFPAESSKFFVWEGEKGG